MQTLPDTHGYWEDMVSLHSEIKHDGNLCFMRIHDFWIVQIMAVTNNLKSNYQHSYIQIIRQNSISPTHLGHVKQTCSRFSQVPFSRMKESGSQVCLV